MASNLVPVADNVPQILYADEIQESRCPICNRYFDDRGHLYRHIRSVHDNIDLVVNRGRPKKVA